ncbi:electron transfer flavoprotein beta subunit [Pseudohyphozyma bogoriensis]|nr:electron transfer flavoprotein beta subunit [Pseudohyphozyma bogoriensis]
MQLLVPIKRTVDYAVKIRVGANGVETAGVKHSLNPFDEIAVEEAVRLRERFKDAIENITVVTIGPPKAADILRTALAMGADSAIHVEVKDGTVVEPLAVAKSLKAIVGTESPDLVIMGKQAIDDDASQVGGMLAGMLSWPQANFASKVDLDAPGKKVTVAREIDGGLETLSMALPAVVTTDLRLNEPRYASLPNIMKAKKKPIKKLKPEDLSVDLTPRLETVKVVAPPARSGGAKVESVDEVVSKLKEAGVLPSPSLDFSHSNPQQFADKLIDLLASEKSDFVEIPAFRGRLFTLQRHFDDLSGDESGWFVVSETKVGLHGERSIATRYVVTTCLDDMLAELRDMEDFAPPPHVEEEKRSLRKKVAKWFAKRLGKRASKRRV